MTELEPVAWRFRWTYPKTGEATTWTLADREEVARQRADEGYEVEPLVTLSSAQSAIAERDARIAELEAALDEKEIASGLTDNGSLWRFWSSRAKDVATKLAASEARAEAAEALLKEAGKVLEPFAKLGDIVLAEAPADSDEVNLYVDCEDNIHWVRNEAFRAARSLMSKIGERNGE